MTSAHALERDVLADPADHDGQLALVVHVLRLARQHDRVAGADHGGVRLEEHQRLGRRLAAHLGGVVGVVLADADHLAARDHRGEQPHVVQRGPDAGEHDRLVQRVALHLGSTTGSPSSSSTTP